MSPEIDELKTSQPSQSSQTPAESETTKTKAAQSKTKVAKVPKEKKTTKRRPSKKAPAGGDGPGSVDSGEASDGSGRKKGADKDKKVDKTKGKGKGKAVEKPDSEIDELDPEVEEDIEPAVSVYPIPKTRLGFADSTRLLLWKTEPLATLRLQVDPERLI
jgi:hypothetical protein